MTDIKHVLATALADEPPSRLDAAAIVRAGRRRVALRRSATAAAVLVAVAAASLPLALGARGPGVDAGTPPPSDIVTTAPSTSSAPPPSARRPPTGPPDVTLPPPAKPLSERRAAELTAVLAHSGALPPVPAKGGRGATDLPWEFFIGWNEYRAAAELTGDRKGTVLIRMSDRRLTCVPVNPSYSTCEWRIVGGVRVAVQTFHYEQSRSIVVTGATADGGTVSVTAVNEDGHGRRTGADTPLTVEEAAKIATAPGLTF
ncbi:hypothetical protein [Saccharothrix australiensis]|uniref:Uncharacterized protein n=1 Tax=Saccharothrix australiensis TaxID=2072 RepID=A0A495VRM2_9PSEU|nr:hypothetical protein [Saccharothrix australiensis]RKT51560.1 hypothetical protein C8E97_0039 [Saccharothrix australiensis]